MARLLLFNKPFGVRSRCADAARVDAPDLRPRDPPIRQRRLIHDRWPKMIFRKGRNRQARRMTAVIGLFAPRLVRSLIGNWSLARIAPGRFVALSEPAWFEVR